MHEAIWLEQLVDELRLERETTTLYCDSRELMKHTGKHRRTKQLNIKDLKIREYVKEREVEIKLVASKANVADMMTKPLPLEAFQRHREVMGLSSSRQKTSSNQGKAAPWQNEVQRAQDEQSSDEADESTAEKAKKCKKDRRGISVRIQMRARAKRKLKRECSSHKWHEDLAARALRL